jgi:hypothetical protein
MCWDSIDLKGLLRIDSGDLSECLGLKCGLAFISVTSLLQTQHDRFSQDKASPKLTVVRDVIVTHVLSLHLLRIILALVFSY